ncbi:unnamed protein product [Arabidopsis arenosa]|uniref:Uncharacterized protein n=1 Tax=Arabidopsis arenosa TaxID=38785 RepID=A0A8S2AAH0_ARAAE|nr:unnamed protein product [Arabidopsis arenosa]
MDETPKNTTPESSSSAPPKWLMKLIGEVNGNERPKLFMSKNLTKNDVSERQACLLIPSKQVNDSSFLTETERSTLLDTAQVGLQLSLVGSGTQTKEVVLKRRRTKGVWGFVLLKWNHVSKEHKLKATDPISLWSFRNGEGNLFLALVHRSDDATGTAIPDASIREDVVLHLLYERAGPDAVREDDVADNIPHDPIDSQSLNLYSTRLTSSTTWTLITTTVKAIFLMKTKTVDIGYNDDGSIRDPVTNTFGIRFV